MEGTSKNDWLVSQSLERSLDVISAINRISIHAKLRSAGFPDDASPEEIQAARQVVMKFLETLSNLIRRAEESEDRIAFGANPRLGSLARRFLTHHAQTGCAVPYHPEELRELKTLLEKGDAAEDGILINELANLRSVLEQHAQTDAAIVFNEA